MKKLRAALLQLGHGRESGVKIVHNFPQKCLPQIGNCDNLYASSNKEKINKPKTKFVWHF
jgi:hypothetical protein